MTHLISLVTELSGANFPSPVPFTIPFSDAHFTAGVYHIPDFTSENFVLTLLPSGVPYAIETDSVSATVVRWENK